MITSKPIIAASILSANFAKLGEDVELVLNSGADWIHFDVMDNHFVPNLTVGPIVCKSLRNYGIKAPIDVHLMVKPVDKLITEFAKAGANSITIHPESTRNINKSLQLIKDSGCKVGIAINPETSLDLIYDLYNQLDLIVIMSVNPGFAGQKFIPNSLQKIKALTTIIKKLNYKIQLSVDGGVNIDNISSLAKAGINVFVAGTSIFKANNYQEAILKLRNKINCSSKL